MVGKSLTFRLFLIRIIRLKQLWITVDNCVQRKLINERLVGYQRTVSRQFSEQLVGKQRTVGRTNLYTLYFLITFLIESLFKTFFMDEKKKRVGERPGGSLSLKSQIRLIQPIILEFRTVVL